MKFAWKQVSSITTSQRHLGSHRMEPTENLHPGDVYQNKVTGYTYEWSLVDSADNGDRHSRGELPPVGTEVEYCGQDGAIEKQCYDLWKNGDTLEVLAHRIVFGTNTPIVFNKRTLDASGMDKKYLIPLKTERERAIEEMLKLDCHPQEGMLSRHDFCGALYDAGYRKEGK